MPTNCLAGCEVKSEDIVHTNKKIRKIIQQCSTTEQKILFFMKLFTLFVFIIFFISCTQQEGKKQETEKRRLGFTLNELLSTLDSEEFERKMYASWGSFEAFFKEIENTNNRKLTQKIFSEYFVVVSSNDYRAIVSTSCENKTITIYHKGLNMYKNKREMLRIAMINDMLNAMFCDKDIQVAELISDFAMANVINTGSNEAWWKLCAGRLNSLPMGIVRSQSQEQLYQYLMIIDNSISKTYQLVYRNYLKIITNVYTFEELVKIDQDMQKTYDQFKAQGLNADEKIVSYFATIASKQKDVIKRKIREEYAKILRKNW